MTFQINSKEFLKALSFAGKTIPTSAIVPIFECVLLEYNSDGSMIITGSDSNTVIQTKAKMSTVDLEGEKSIKIAAPYDLLSRTLATIPNAPISVTYTVEGDIFTLQIDYEDLNGRNAIFNMACEDARTYFKVPEIKDGQVITMGAQALQRGLDNLINFVSDDPAIPAYTGINVKFNDGKVLFSATNRFIIGMYENEFHDEAVDSNVIIPFKFCKLLSDFIGDITEEIAIEISDRFIKAQLGEWVAYSTLVDDKFPDCKKTIPDSFEYKAVINAEDLKMAIKRASVYADPQDSTMKMVFNEKNLFLSAEFPQKNQKCDQDIAIDSEIDGFKIGFNMKTLSKLLQTVSGDFEMSFVAHNRGALIKPDVAEGESIDYIIMPVVALT